MTILVSGKCFQGVIKSVFTLASMTTGRGPHKAKETPNKSHVLVSQESRNTSNFMGKDSQSREYLYLFEPKTNGGPPPPVSPSHGRARQPGCGTSRFCKTRRWPSLGLQAAPGGGTSGSCRLGAAPFDLRIPMGAHRPLPHSLSTTV